jgi:hypothetical protein
VEEVSWAVLLVVGRCVKIIWGWLVTIRALIHFKAGFIPDNSRQSC